MVKTGYKKIASVLIFFSLLTAAYAHEGSVEIYEQIKSDSILYIEIAGIIAILSVLFSIYYKTGKIVLFLFIAVPVLFATIYLAGSTIYLNSISETKGPVHWHADFEIWNCNEFIDIIDTTGIENRVGTPVLHEHGDVRIHVEGVLVEKRHSDMHSFFEVLGGTLAHDKLVVPTNSGMLEINNGDSCNSKPGMLQAFLYRVTNAFPSQETGFIYEQIKLEDFEDYIISPYISVPPGDCIIIEFGPENNATERICETYEIAIQKGDMRKG